MSVEYNQNLPGPVLTKWVLAYKDVIIAYCYAYTKYEAETYFEDMEIDIKGGGYKVHPEPKFF
jgi:hypothetical protein